MNLAISEFSRSVTAEIYKLKRTPILWISIIGGMTSAIIVFLMFLILIDEFVNFNQTPWAEYYQICHGLLTNFLLVPYIVLASSTIIQAEHNSNAWKYLYALPLNKSSVYFSKMLVTIALIAMALAIFWVASLMGGYIIGYFRPEYEFLDYSAAPFRWLSVIFHTFIASLGVAALQYWFNIRWKNYIIPISIGLLGFIFAVLVVGEDRIALYFPYCYPMHIAEKMDYAKTFDVANPMTMGISKAEWNSLIVFAVFSVIGFYEQKIRNVK
ncbi:MAG TPA: ABC transporter permease [Flavilitoribacter sp.]|nr:ABC transporter permease [Flavilitoribacter sp.]HMQ89110.1 ABC transporter permease [Flavilitoribacter sp.]